MESKPKLTLKKKPWPLIHAIKSTIKDFFTLKPGEAGYNQTLVKVFGTLFILFLMVSVFFDLRQHNSMHLLLRDLFSLAIGVATGLFFAGIKYFSLQHPKNRLLRFGASLYLQTSLTLVSLLGVLLIQNPGLLPFRLASFGALTALCLSLISKTGIIGIAFKGLFGGTISYFTQRWWKSRERKTPTTDQ